MKSNKLIDDVDIEDFKEFLSDVIPNKVEKEEDHFKRLDSSINKLEKGELTKRYTQYNLKKLLKLEESSNLTSINETKSKFIKDDYVKKFKDVRIQEIIEANKEKKEHIEDLIQLGNTPENIEIKEKYTFEEDCVNLMDNTFKSDFIHSKIVFNEFTLMLTSILSMFTSILGVS